MKSHTFNGKRYLITIEQLDGICDTYKKERELIVMADLATKKGMETVIHEALHACNWSAKEKSVTITAKDVARFLWRLGYRCRP